MVRNDKFRRFSKQPIFLGDVFDSTDSVTAILAQSFHHRHPITATT
ncbi:hypothetical protein XBP1_2990100 [Xenorhabdus bovienii str. puntauvense]|uniref:Uncharacterized protein n=4 Tax=Xenorhabdus bovienii TaxID=40576 RepID=A0A0B6XDA2_XENBV|nr:hypothetical protein XBFFR1_1840034 [Xenorhabdus bovienii str. feltiae France]CDG94051.1 hypothetical protein XBFFL1_310035 [Xenorhabdus bovienii str. feltiae Florida]CDG98316.1 hypothetical protein XBP1_2990100 [Xenorhabdus bovienii str. puntauvense]CDG99988.1 hypothetical protein XBFM1_1260137 [Xenorhabdus bovienii str. feltiae Moldova]CDH23685.1 hypothetical protein XBKB1_20010 [Xenorhabdus bovienii str. kraussei Becker Underwood]CDM91807.1 protein of unknown function [Xenorhabdus bovien